ncbi:MAG: HEPN domain-containing protein [Treponema sp.]|jgi:HEPN domain-containing protein|nr:HEPN domain-containing protein [Treponema sp.]
MERYESWIERAKSSYDLSKAAISPAIFFEDLCYQAQQTVEKALKGLLLYYGVEPVFTHNIGVLLNELGKHTEVTDTIREAMKLTNYAVQTRYPGEYDDITREEYENALRIAKHCLDWVEREIKEKAR